jgi:hypothetical protein
LQQRVRTYDLCEYEKVCLDSVQFFCFCSHFSLKINKSGRLKDNIAIDERNIVESLKNKRSHSPVSRKNGNGTAQPRTYRCSFLLARALFEAKITLGVYNQGKHSET